MCSIRREFLLMKQNNIDIEEPDEDFDDNTDPLAEFGYEPI